MRWPCSADHIAPMVLVVTAGHVDHGKSSLVRAITGTDPDRLAEEKRRGMTIELGFAHAHCGDTTLSFVDAPGHADLVRTMIAGASAVDTALLVIDAREGWMPQTHEHLSVLELLGVERGVVALTKCDLVDDDALAAVRAETDTVLSTSPIDWYAIVPVSVVDGRGIDELVARLATTPEPRVAAPDRLRRTRMFVDRVFTIAGAGTVVTGTLEHGSVSAGDSLEVTRSGQIVRVRSVQTHGITVEAGLPGTRCAVNLGDASVDDVRRGDALVTPLAWHTSNVIDVRLALARDVDEPPRSAGGHVAHFGTDRQVCSLRVLAEPDTYRIRFDSAWPITPGDRLIVRRTGDSVTIAGATVLDVAPRRRLGHARPDGTVEAQLVDHGWIDIDVARRLTGENLQAVTGRWCAAPSLAAATIASLTEKLDKGALALDQLAPWEREIVSTMPGIVTEAGIARRENSVGLDNDPVAQEIRSWGLTGPGTASFERNAIRRLVAAGIIFEHDGIAFHRVILDEMTPVLAELLALHPGGITVSMVRERLGITRKHAVPLVECLDRAGYTVRRGDMRLAGPRMRNSTT